MLQFIANRILTMIGMTLVLSFVCFFIIQLPPGDVISAYAAELSASGDSSSTAQVTEMLRQRYGLDQPFFVQYLKWLRNLLVGDLGYSFNLGKPVAEIINSRIGISLLVEIMAVTVLWGIAVPIGIYSAVRRYSVGDMFATVFGFIGLAVPNFLLALLIMYAVFLLTGTAVEGLFSAEYANAPWSLGRILDFLSHVWIPVLVIATGGAAHIIRVLRANLLDELHKPYVVTARAKGMKENRLIMRYPVRVAMIPLVATVGWVLPTVISSSIVTAIVLNLPTLSPILLRSLLSQDMHLAGALILFMGILTLVGTLVSDLLLAWIDPRIRTGMAR
ncbi:ABC transporter permease [Qingshengfaniella alkalisoli]|uniref:ABC transporter permease n=1 Tax=Qingshengfaniella alkalisoli TaxID=2599296 RepID=A0A5B8I6P0_9RHOB|nr:ABC transporter permease [Qingshengfaniella alkalisoli]QDY69215.1 ABC transporter permease [Qingshengfaniella alkalisoli]